MGIVLSLPFFLQIQYFGIEKDFALSNNDVRCFVEDNEGSVWIGIFKGLDKIDTTGAVFHYQKDTKPGSLLHSSVFSLYKDSQGTIWTGTYYGGVHYCNPKMDYFKHYSENADRVDCLSFFFVSNMVEDKRGDIWICTEGGGLNYFNRNTRQFIHYLTEKEALVSSFYNLKCIEYDSIRDCIYVGTHKQGFFCFDLSSKKVKYHTEEAGVSLAKITLRGDSLYMLSENGMFVKDLKTGTIGRLYPSIRDTHGGGSSFLIDSKGYIWLAQFHQIVRVNMRNPEERAVYRCGENGLGKWQVLKLVEYTDGTIYFGTYGSGLYRFNPQTDAFEQCPIHDIRYCYNMAVTPHGSLAISNEKGLLMYHPQTRETRLISADDNLHLSAINDGCGLLICRNGETFVGGTSGMTSFMAEYLTPPSSYNLFFSTLSVNDKSVSCEVPNGILDVALPFARRINLRHHENNLSVTVDTSQAAILRQRLARVPHPFDADYLADRIPAAIGQPVALSAGAPAEDLQEHLPVQGVDFRIARLPQDGTGQAASESVRTGYHSLPAANPSGLQGPGTTPEHRFGISHGDRKPALLV